MKKFLKLSLVFAVVLTTMTAHANEIDFLLFAKSKDGKQITFSINGIQEVYLSIYDKDGQKIYAEKATGEKGVVRTYNLEQFPEGKYILEVKNDFKKVKYEIVITNLDASLSSKGISEIYKITPTTKEKLASR